MGFVWSKFYMEKATPRRPLPCFNFTLDSVTLPEVINEDHNRWWLDDVVCVVLQAKTNNVKGTALNLWQRLPIKLQKGTKPLKLPHPQTNCYGSFSDF